MIYVPDLAINVIYSYAVGSADMRAVSRAPMLITAAVIAALCMASAGGEAAAHDVAAEHGGTVPSDRTFNTGASNFATLQPWWTSNPTPEGVTSFGTESTVPKLSELSEISLESARRLVNGTASVTRVVFSGGVGHAGVGDAAPEFVPSEWTLIEGAAADVNSSCMRVNNGGIEREMYEIFAQRAGATSFVVHEALSSTDARMHMIYHPGATPALEHTAPNVRFCAYVNDGITYAGESMRTTTGDIAGTVAAHTGLLSFGQDVSITGSKANLASNTAYYYGNMCGPDDVSGCDADLTPTTSLDTVGPVPNRSYLITIPAGSDGRAALDAAGTGQTAEFFGLSWYLNSANYFQKTSDSSRIMLPSPRVMPIRDALPPAPTTAIAGSGSTDSPYRQTFSEAPYAPAGGTVFDGVSIFQTTNAGVRTEITDATVTGVSGSTVSFTTGASIFAQYHIEYVGIADAAGSVAVKPRIVEIDPVSTTTTTVRFNVPIFGTTDAGDWFVSGSNPTVARAAAVAVAPGIVADPTDDPTGEVDITVTRALTLTLEHAAIADASTLSVEYIPTEHFATFGDRFDDRLGASSLRLETAGPIPEGLVSDMLRFEAEFTAANMIQLTANVDLADATIVQANFPVTIPDGSDSGTDPDPVTVTRLSHTAGSRSFTIELSADATPGVVHTIRPTTSVQDSGSRPYVATQTPPTASYTAPPPESLTITAAELRSTTQVVATISADVDAGTTIVGSEWNIGSGMAFDGGSVSGATVTLTRNADNPLPSTGVTTGQMLRYTGSGSVSAGMAQLANGATAPLTDRARPTFSAQVNDGAQVVLTFSEAVTRGTPGHGNALDFGHNIKPGRIVGVTGVISPQGGEPLDVMVWPTSNTFDATARTATLQFGGTVDADTRTLESGDSCCRRTFEATPGLVAMTEAGAMTLLTSTPTIVNTETGNAVYQDTAGNTMLNSTVIAVATDNARPVAFAEFTDGDTIMVKLSEEMATPSNAVLGGITVERSGTSVPIMGTPGFTAHTAASSSATFGQPTIEITLASAASAGDHVISFPTGLVASGGPANKRTVADAMATAVTDLAFEGAKFTGPRTIVLTINVPLTANTATAANFSVTEPDGSDSGSERDNVPLASTNAVDYTAGSLTVTLTLASDAGINKEYRILPSTGVQSSDGTPYAGSHVSVRPTDLTRPTFTAAFQSADRILLTASEALDSNTVIAANFGITVPDGPDADSDPDTVDLDTTNPIAHTAGSTLVSLNLDADSTEGVVHTITPSTAITDTAGITYAGTALTLTRTDVPTFTAEVRDGSMVVIRFSEPVSVISGRTFSHTNFVHHPYNHEAANAIEIIRSGGTSTPTGLTPVVPSSGTLTPPAEEITLAFTGNEAIRLKTSTPLIAYAVNNDSNLNPVLTLEDAAGNAMANRTIALAADNASPVARAAFMDSNTIMVTFSEEMIAPSSTIRGNVGVTASGSSVAISGTPEFTAHTSAGRTTAIVLPTLEIELAEDATSGTEHTITFPGFSAATGPTDKRAVAAATATAPTDLTFEGAKFTGPRTIVLTINVPLTANTATAANFSVTEPDGSDSGSERDPVALALTNAVDYTAGSLTVTLTLAGDADTNKEYWITPSTGVQASDGTPYAGSEVRVTPTDLTRPTFIAEFQRADYILLRASEALDDDTVIAANFGLTVPDNTNTPHDADSDPDPVTFAFSHTAGSTLVGLTLAADSAEGVTHTITPSTDITDVAGIEYAGTALTLTRTDAPTFTAEVRDGPMVVITFSEPVSVISGRTFSHINFVHHPFNHEAQNALPIIRSGGNPSGRSDFPSVDPSSGTLTSPATTLTLGFTGDAANRLKTSRPLIAYAYGEDGFAPFMSLADAANNAMANRTIALATDNASPVARAAFMDSNTIRVTFSEEMVAPSSTVRGNVGVTSSGTPVAISGTPEFTAHTPEGRTAAIVLPTLEIELAEATTSGTEHTITFPGFMATFGPSDKREVADATVTFTDTTAPSFVVHKISNTRLMVTFSEEVQRVSGQTRALDDWSIETSPADMTDNLVNPTAVTYGHNFADLTIAAVGNAILPTVRYVESTAAIEDLAGNDLPVTASGSAVAASASPIPLSASHTRTSSGASEITVTFSEQVKGTTSASDWSVSGATVTSAAFTTPATTVTLGGFTLANDASPRLTYSGTTLTADETTSPPAVDARELEAADAVLPVIASARAISTTQIEVTFSESVRFKSIAAFPQAGPHWMIVLDGTETAISAISSAMGVYTLTVSNDDAWTGADTPDVKYIREVTGVQDSDNGRIIDGANNELASVTFTDTANAQPLALASIATGDELRAIGNLLDPADNTYTDYVTVTITRPIELTDSATSSAAQRAGHWTVTDDDPDGSGPMQAPAVTVTDATVSESGFEIRLALATGLASTASTPTVAYDASSANAGRIVLEGQAPSDSGALLASFAAMEATDGIPPRLTEYPSRADTTPDTTANDRLGIAFTYSEPIDAASLENNSNVAWLAFYRSVVASSFEDKRGLSGFAQFAPDVCARIPEWAPQVSSLLRKDASDTYSTTGSDPPYLGDGGNVVTYSHLSQSSATGTPVRQHITATCLEGAGAPSDEAGNQYRVTPRGEHRAFFAVVDNVAPDFVATATSASTVQVVYREPVEIVPGATVDASEWRIDLSPNDTTDNMDSDPDWITPTSATHSLGAFPVPEHFAYGAPDHLEATDSRLTITLGGLSGLNPDLKSAATDARPIVYYDAAGSGASADIEVRDKYGNVAAETANARLVDTTPPSMSAAFADESTVRVTFSEPPRDDPTRASGTVFAVHAAGSNTDIAGTATYTAATATDPARVDIAISATPAAVAHEVRITGAEISDGVGAAGALAPRTWYDYGTHGSASTASDVPGNAADVSSHLAVPAPPAPPTFSAMTTSLIEVDVAFSVPLARVGTSPPALDAASWAVELVAEGMTPTERTAATTDDIDVTGVEAITDSSSRITGVTITLDEDDDQIGDTSKRVFVTYVASTSELITVPPTGTIARTLAEDTGAFAVDGAPVQFGSAMTATEADLGPRIHDPADNVYTDSISVGFTEPVELSDADSSTVAQRTGHWTVVDDDPDGSGPMSAPAIAVTDVTISESGMEVILSLATRLSSTAATPTVAYDSTTHDSGRIIDPSLPSSNPGALVDSFEATEAADGIGPRLLALPVRGDLNPDDPLVASSDTMAAPLFAMKFTDADTIVLTSSRPLSTSTAVVANFEVTAPDNTNSPDDADSDADVIALATADAMATPPVVPFAYAAGPPVTITLTLAADATEGVVYTVTPSTSVQSSNSVAYAAGAVFDEYGDVSRKGSVLQFSEAIDPAAFAIDSNGRIISAPLTTARLQIDTSSPTNRQAPTINTDGACSTGTNWLPRSLTVAIDSYGVANLGTNGDTVIVDNSDDTAFQGNGFICLSNDSAVMDLAGNSAVRDEPAAASSMLTAIDDTAPEFLAMVTSATEITVVYNEPVDLVDLVTPLTASDWRVDLSPGDTTDNVDTDDDWVTPTLSHEFGPMINPELYFYGAPDHHVQSDSRLIITLGGFTGLDPDATTMTPTVYYDEPDGQDADVRDKYGNFAATEANVQAMDSTPPAITAISVGVSTAATTQAPIPNVQFARASTDNPVAVKFDVTFDEPPKSGVAPLVSVYKTLRLSTTVEATEAEQDSARTWPMTVVANSDSLRWEYEWTVINPIEGETTPRGWGSGAPLLFNIHVRDDADNNIVYRQDSRSLPDGSTTMVTLDSAPPAVSAVSLKGRPAGATGDYTFDAGKSGSDIALMFTVTEIPSRLHNFDRNDVMFFSGADATAATALTGTGTAADPYVATATIPDGHADGEDAIAWSISVLDVYGQSGTLASADAALGFAVDNVAPTIVASSSTVSVERTDSRATDRAGAGETITTSITFDEAIAMTPQVRAAGDSLTVVGDAPPITETYEFHALTDMTVVANTGRTQWEHTYTVPASATTPLHKATYEIELEMPTDDAGNMFMMCSAGCGLGTVGVDNVAPVFSDVMVIHGVDDNDNPIDWAVIEYEEHGGLALDSLRTFVNSTTNTMPTDWYLLGGSDLFVRISGDGISGVSSGYKGVDQPGDRNFSARLSFDYESSGNPAGSATTLTDLSYNAVTWTIEEPPAYRATNANRPAQMDGDLIFVASQIAEVGAAVAISTPADDEPFDFTNAGLGTGNPGLDFAVDYASSMQPDLSVRLDAGTQSDVASLTVIERAEGHDERGTEYYVAILAREDADAADAPALRALAEEAPLRVVEVGSESAPVYLSKAARIDIGGAHNSLYAYYIDDAGTATPTDDIVRAIDECDSSTAEAADSSEVGHHMTAPGAPQGSMIGNQECFVRNAQDEILHIWTNHFTPFGASAQQLSLSRASGCDDCTPPTLGVDSTGVRRVSGGFTYNGQTHNAEYYYTPMPIIEVETGVENSATIKIFEDSGVTRIAHAGLAFGLSRGQHFAEANAEIRVSVSHTGELSIALDDPAGAIDTETLRASSEVVECMPTSTAECLAITINHTFREPLDFDVVSTNIWDTRLNAWQNFFNHGVHVSGESLNPSRGIEVNGGDLVLYPLISGLVDEDGDGIYDYDERHVTYMLDESYAVYRLTPDGTYQPLRNLYALYHEIDDAMYDDDRIRSHGAMRTSPHFDAELARQEAIAMEIMAELGVIVESNEMPKAAPSLYEGMVVKPRLEVLNEVIAKEINQAEHILHAMSPALARGK